MSFGPVRLRIEMPVVSPGQTLRLPSLRDGGCGCAEDPGAGLVDERRGKTEVDPRGGVEAGECLGGEFEPGGAQGVPELAEAAGADDGVNDG